MRRPSAILALVMAIAGGLAMRAAAADGGDPPSTADRPDHLESAERHDDEPPPPIEVPPLPEGMSLEDVLERAAQPPPESYPAVVPDDALRGFFLLEQLEYRVRSGDGDELGWEAQGWLGWDYDRIVVKTEGEAGFEGPDEGGSEIDLLYSRVVTPFWSVQAGVHYANGWESGSYEDRWAGALAVQGMTPGKVETDVSMYVSEDADVTFEVEAEYNIRVTQRLVLQPRAELDFAAQDIPELDIGAGLVDATLDVRVRYEIRRGLAPYAGARFRFLVGETADIAASKGLGTSPIFLVSGLRLAF
jgi:copper resistance protein B